MDLSLPLDYSAIERILPHRYPFLLVDRIIEFDPDKRIVGIKNVTLNERYLSHQPGEPPVLPPTILTEAVAQVGAIMILAKPENREKLIYFMGIERVRYRRPVHPAIKSSSRPSSDACEAGWACSAAWRASTAGSSLRAR
jgi:3-hydroxymyristoyl/3-hydroxydecanoyl-(acyl carrier protein) dehydratases